MKLVFLIFRKMWIEKGKEYKLQFKLQNESDQKFL